MLLVIKIFDINIDVSIKTYLYVLAANHLQLKCVGGHFSLGHPYIERTTVLSDNYYYYYYYYYLLSILIILPPLAVY